MENFLKVYMRGETGLSNPQNSCYANAVLQALLNTPRFTSLFMRVTLRPYVDAVRMGRAAEDDRRRGEVTACISALADNFWNGKFSIIDTSCVLEVFANCISRNFDGSTTQDAHEV